MLGIACGRNGEIHKDNYAATIIGTSSCVVSSVTVEFSSGITEDAYTHVPAIPRRIHNVIIAAILRLLVLNRFFIFVFFSVLSFYTSSLKKLLSQPYFPRTILSFTAGNSSLLISLGTCSMAWHNSLGSISYSYICFGIPCTSSIFRIKYSMRASCKTSSKKCCTRNNPGLP